MTDMYQTKMLSISVIDFATHTKTSHERDVYDDH